MIKIQIIPIFSRTAILLNFRDDNPEFSLKNNKIPNSDQNVGEV